MMPVMEHAGLDAIPLLAIDALGLTADVVFNSRGSHQIAFISGVDEHLAAIRFAAQSANRSDSSAGFSNSTAAIEPFIARHWNLIFAHEAFEDLFRDVRFEDPHGALGAVDCGSALSFISILRLFLPIPGHGFLVMLPDAMVEFSGEAADDRLVAGVCETQ